MIAWAHPWTVVLLGVVLLLLMARLAAVRPSLRPLVGPFTLVVVAVMVFIPAGYEHVLTRGWASLAILLPILVLVVRGSVVVFQALFRNRQGTAPPALLDSVISVMLYGIGAGVVAHHWFGIQLAPFLATSAVVGAVVGLALQDTLGNLFAGIALHTEAPFRVGDWVRLQDLEGQVEQVSWRAMRLRTWYGDTLTIPNNEVARHAIQNFSVPRTPHSRVISVGVNYRTPPNKVIAVLYKLLAQIPGVAAEPAPLVRIVGYEDFAVRYEVCYAVASFEGYRVTEGEIYRMIWYHFRRQGIEIPFPTRHVLLQTLPSSSEVNEAGSRLERALRAIDLFRPLNEDEMRMALARFRPLHYSAGETIIEEGASGDSFFVIDAGEVEVFKKLGGARRALARLMVGQFFGEMALLTGERRAATVIAVTDVDLFMIDKSGFHDVLVAHPAIAEDISTILSERREALSQAEGDITTQFQVEDSPAELKQRILKRIRGYFGL